MMDQSDVLNDLDQLRSRYDVLRELGRDGANVVYAARTPGNGRHFAVQVVADAESRSSKPGALQPWQAHTVRPLEHAKLMVLHAVHHLQGGSVAVAMDRRRGRTLAEKIEEDGSLPVEEVESILRDVAEALAYLHGRGVVHRTVSPHSIFLDRDRGHARLAYFGVDRRDPIEAGRRISDDLLRTYGYLAPEQFDGRTRVEGRSVAVQTDLYGLGLAAYAMLTGAHPWEGLDPESYLDRRKRELPPLATRQGDVPAYLSVAIDGCLQSSPRRRWRDVEELLAQLEPRAEPPRAAWRTDLGERWASTIDALQNKLREPGGTGARLVIAATVASAIPTLLIGRLDTTEVAPPQRSLNLPAVESAPPPLEDVELRAAPSRPFAPGTGPTIDAPGSLALPSGFEDETPLEAAPAPKREAKPFAVQRFRAAPPSSPTPAANPQPAPEPAYVLLGEPLRIRR